MIQSLTGATNLIPRSPWGKVVYRYNRAGFRDVEHEVEKPSGIQRIVVLGDSVTERYGVEWRDVFANILQSRLGEKHEVINIAAGGLNTPQEVHLLEKEGLRYKPDLVVINYRLRHPVRGEALESVKAHSPQRHSGAEMIVSQLAGVLDPSRFRSVVCLSHSRRRNSFVQEWKSLCLF